MSATASFSHGIAGRYATALFELARDENALDSLSADMGALDAAIESSADLRGLISSPVYSRSEMGASITAIAEKMDLSALVRNTLSLMAAKRRLFVLPAVVGSIKALIAAEKGEVSADVTSATPLTDAQTAKLAEQLKAAFGSDILINSTVDERIIGGLVVKVGSKMIDTSIASKLNNLQNAMKEVG